VYQQNVMKLMIGATLTLAVLGSTAPAHADVGHAAYVDELQKAGIPGTSDQILNNGYVICQALNAGHDVVEVAALTARPTGMPVAQTGFEVGAAIRWLCPAQQWQIKELANADPSVPGVTTAIAGFAG
jgi:uncharacterized protein DUF732